MVERREDYRNMEQILNLFIQQVSDITTTLGVVSSQLATVTERLNTVMDSTKRFEAEHINLEHRVDTLEQQSSTNRAKIDVIVRAMKIVLTGCSAGLTFYLYYHMTGLAK